MKYLIVDYKKEEGMEKEQEFEFYSEEEVKKIIKNKEELFFADDGIDEVVVRFKDIPDFIVDVNLKFDSKNLKFYKVGKGEYTPDITTIGFFLDKVKPEIREKIIDRLVKLQTGEIEPKKYKLIDENTYEKVTNRLEQEALKKKNKKKNKEAR